MARPDHVPDRLVVDFDALGELRIAEVHAEVHRWRTEIGSVVWTDHNGPHRCIGAALARTMLTVALDEFHAFIPAYRLLESDSQLGAVWSMKSVVLEWDPSDVSASADLARSDSAKVPVRQ